MEMFKQIGQATGLISDPMKRQEGESYLAWQKRRKTEKTARINKKKIEKQGQELEKERRERKAAHAAAMEAAKQVKDFRKKYKIGQVGDSINYVRKRLESNGGDDIIVGKIKALGEGNSWLEGLGGENVPVASDEIVIFYECWGGESKRKEFVEWVQSIIDGEVYYLGIGAEDQIFASMDKNEYDLDHLWGFLLKLKIEDALIKFGSTEQRVTNELARIRVAISELQGAMDFIEDKSVVPGNIKWGVRATIDSFERREARKLIEKSQTLKSQVRKVQLNTSATGVVDAFREEAAAAEAARAAAAAARGGRKRRRRKTKKKRKSKRKSKRKRKPKRKTKRKRKRRTKKR